MKQTAERIAQPIAERYQLVHQAGVGNMSTVYEAIDLRVAHRRVAIKLLDSHHPDALKQEFFKRETTALERLEHPHIITLYDSGLAEDLGCFYLALEYLPQTLNDLIAQHPDQRDQAWCWPVMHSLIDAIAYAHSEGVIHRDLKSTNILIAEDGTPKVSDFGISRLLYELSQGTTVSSFFSVGFAAPEQRRGEAITVQSDLYSLGCIFYHLLSRSTPPPDGPTFEMLRVLHLPRSVEQILQQLLAPDPVARFPTALQAQRRIITLTETLVPPPVVSLQITPQVRRKLADVGFLSHNTPEAAVEFLQQDLDGAAQVYASRDAHAIWRLITDQLQLLCARDARAPVLIVNAVRLADEPDVERSRNFATPVRFAWQVVDGVSATQLSPTERSTAQATLDALGTQLEAHATARMTQRAQERARRDFVQTWQNVISYQQQQFQKAGRLRYVSFGKTGGTLLFTLHDLPPDDLAWPDGAPMGVFDEPDDLHGYGIGHFVRLQGQDVHVALDMLALGEGTGIERIPANGWLGVYQKEAAAALDRQKYALGLVRSGGTLNTDLPAVLMEVATARFGPVEEELDFFQTDLAEDKRQAVRQALATHDLFILQGPPGTGKTTALAEIILQIRKRTPNARILISSQSNVATDHILSRVAAVNGNHQMEIVRLGRPQKIGHAAQEWTLDQRMASWRAEVMNRTDPVLKELNRRISERQRAHAHAEAASTDYLADLEQCQLLLADVERDLAAIAEQQRQITGITSQQPRGEIGADAQQAIDDCGRVIAEHVQACRANLRLISAYLPDDLQKPPAEVLTEEYEHLKSTVERLLQREAQDQDTALRSLVNDWRRVFGRVPDFAEPILARADILAATCLITGGRYLKNEEFDWAIIDEAGRATAPELLVPLVHARRAIIVGDERQLPPMLDEDLDDATLAQLGTSAEELSESLFAALVAQGITKQLPAVQMLTAQHRMHPAIGRLVSAVFYDGMLTHAVEAADRAHRLAWIPAPVVWCTTSHLPHHFETQQGTSFYNRVEVTGTSDLLHRMEWSYRELGEQRSVAVITPYQAQIAELTASILPQNPLWQALDIEIATVDAFQGRDRDILIYSTVRSNAARALGFLRDRRRLNVALSRARQLLVIVGDMRMLEQAHGGVAGNPFQELVRYLRDHPEECCILPLDGEAR